MIPCSLSLPVVEPVDSRPNLDRGIPTRPGWCIIVIWNMYIRWIGVKTCRYNIAILETLVLWLVSLI